MKQLIEDFIKFVEINKVPIEAICLSDKNGLILSHHFIKNKAKRNIYSHTKSFTSTLVGIAIDEGVLSLEDSLFDFFKEDIPISNYEAYRKIKVKHLLNMNSGIDDTGFLFGEDRVKGEGYPDYIKYMLNKVPRNEPGSKFVYSNADTYLLGCILEKIYGQTLLKIANDKLFSEIGIETCVWGNCPLGHTFGASDLYLTLEDMNKLGILFLNKGKWNGKQIVSEKWVERCSKSQTETGFTENNTAGYSNQWWICDFLDCYRADGMYGQFTIVFPSDGYAVSIQSPEWADSAQFNLSNFINEVVKKMTR